MELKNIKKGVLGLNRADVYEYISKLNKEFSDRFSEQKREADDQIRVLVQKNEGLNGELVRIEGERDSAHRELERRTEELERLACEVSELKEQLAVERERRDIILLEAKRFADWIGAKTAEKTSDLLDS